MSNLKRDYCRLCAGYQPTIKLVELQNDKKKCQDITTKLYRFNIQVNLDDAVLNNVVCITCVTSLEHAFNFVAAVEQGQLALNNLLSVRQIKEEKNEEIFSEDTNSSYEEGDSLTENFVNIADVKVEYRDDQRNDHNEHFSDDVYTKNVHVKGESNEKNDEHVNLKSGNVKQIKTSVSDSEKCIYGLVTEKNVLAMNVESKKAVSSSKSAPSTSKNCKQSTNSKKLYYQWKSLPLSELELSWDDYIWICSYCETQFPNLDELRTHSMQYHNACNPYQCTDCKIRKLHLHSFLVHVKRHRQYLKFSCYKCPIKFSNVVEASQHREVHMNSDFICFGCNTNFSSQKEWFAHTQTFYKNSRATSILALQNDSLTCHICHKICRDKNHLNGHLLTHTNNICEICGKCYYQKTYLQYHLATHSDARPFQCEICTSRFKTQRRLKLHISTHDGNKPFTCDTCGKCFRLKTHLVNHIIIHTDNLPHVCTYCEKRFRNKGLLTQHIRQHTGVKPYSCDICKRDFTNWANYNKHMKRKHDMNMAKKKRTPEGPFPIDPSTGEVLYPSEKKMTQWKQKIMELKNAGRKSVTKRKKAGHNNN